MPCYHPIAREVKGKAFFLPCGQCIGCRLEYSRQWAVRCMHEAMMYDDNCMVTLTYDDDHVPVLWNEHVAESLTLNTKHLTNFMKYLRKEMGNGIRFYGCGEYGENFERPHYHICLFNCRFTDRTEIEPSKTGFEQYGSEQLDRIWKRGRATILDLTFQTAAYVSRYVTKKITGKIADEYYAGREPEFSRMSRRPGIGQPFYDRFKNDMYNHDVCIVSKEIKCRPPRYYDKKFEEDCWFESSDRLEKIKNEREIRGDKKFPGWRRLRDMEQFQIESREFFTKGKR